MRILITRPQEDSVDLAEKLSGLGSDPIIEPLFDVQVLETARLDMSDVHAIVLTSANGARALTNRDVSKELPVYAVGESTALAAREAGFKLVLSADGGVDELAQLIRDQMPHDAGVLLHIAGTAVAGDLGGELGAAGYTYRRAVLYDAVPVRTLSASTVAALKDGTVDAVMLYSPRAAGTFVELVRKARLVRACRGLVAICLSNAVAEALDGLQWQEVRVARQPNQEAILQVVKPDQTTTDTTDVKDEVPSGGAVSEELPSTASGAQPRPGMGPFSKALVYLASLIVLVAVAAGTGPLWVDSVREVIPGLDRKSATEDMVSALSGRIAELERAAQNESVPGIEDLQAERKRLQEQLESTLGRLTELESSLGSVRQMMNALNAELAPGEAEGALRKLSDRLAALEQSAAGSVGETAETIGRLSKQLAELEQKVPAPDLVSGKHRAALLAIGQLREAVNDGGPFSRQLEALTSVADEELLKEAGLEILAASAEKGVATEESLKAAFSDLAGRIVRAGLINEEGGWVDKTISRLTAPIRWRRTDELEGSDVQSVVARAEVRIKADDLVSAVTELSGLEGPPAEIAASWLEQAKTLLAARQALSELHAGAIERLNSAAR